MGARQFAARYFKREETDAIARKTMDKSDKNSIFVLSYDENGRKMYTCEADPNKR